MKKLILCVCIIFAATASFAQTKRIEHRSHSGSNKTFTTRGNSNFGLTPEMKKKKDSAVAKAKDITAQKIDTIKAKPRKKVSKKTH